MRVISLFSGAGGLDLGVEATGANIVLAVEFDHDAAETLKLNNKNKNKVILEKDIAEVSFKDFASDAETTVVIGGPPCQPFSKNGYWIKNENRLISKDPRNMISQFLRTLEESRANGFLFENVESILHPTNKPEFNRFLNEAAALGYTCTVFKTNAADFGVPQKRKRVFVFGIRKKGQPIPLPQRTHRDPAEVDLLETNLKPYVGVGPFISKFNTENYFEKYEVAENGNYFFELTNVPAGKNYIALSKLKDYEGRSFRTGARFWNFLHKLHPDEPSITIAAQPGPWVGPFHWDNRRLRVPEMAAIQTFPEDYVFVGNRRSINKQIGNAVPVLLGKQMFEHLVKHL